MTFSRSGSSCTSFRRTPDDLPEGRRKYGFDNLEFKYLRARLGVTRRCVVAQRLPDYPVAIIRTGQLQRVGRGRHGLLWKQLWGGEFRFAEGDRDAAHPG